MIFEVLTKLLTTRPCHTQYSRRRPCLQHYSNIGGDESIVSSVRQKMQCRPAALHRVLRQLHRRAASSSAPTAKNEVIFSGIQPTGTPHLGNYLGALQNWKRLQDEAAPDTKLLYSIVDLHAITMPQQAPMLRQWKREMLAALLAIGLDPSRSIIFYQSSVGGYENPWLNVTWSNWVSCWSWCLGSGAF